MYTRLFWRDAAERVLSTFVQAFVGAVVVALSTLGTDFLTADWRGIGLSALTAGIAAVASLVKAFLAARKVNANLSPASLASDTERL